MKFPLAIGTLLAALPLFAAEPAVDPKSLDGTWQLTKGEIGGQPMPQEAVSKITLTMKGSDYEVFVSAEARRDQGTFKMNPAADPKSIEITGTNGPNKGKTLLAIYKREGDTLQVCYDLSGLKRPTEFKAPAGTLTFLATYERKKDSK